VEREIISTDWRDSGDTSNENSRQKEACQDQGSHYKSESMSENTTIEQIQKGLKYRELFIYLRRVRGRNGTLPNTTKYR